MTDTVNTRIENPSTCFMQWEGSTGRFKYWHKELKCNIYVDAPFTFVVLDTLYTIKGFNDHHQSGIWSNEVRNVYDLLKVQTKLGVVAFGNYKSIKGRVSGSKFTQSVYIAFKDHEGKLQLGNFQMFGSALNSWMDFVKPLRNGGAMQAIEFSGVQDAKKGTNEYFKPVFKVKNISNDTKVECGSLFMKLSAYLFPYLNKNTQENREFQKNRETATVIANLPQTVATLAEATV